MRPFVITDGSPWPLGTFAALAAEPRVRHGVTTRDGPAFDPDGTTAQTAAAAVCRGGGPGPRRRGLGTPGPRRHASCG